MPIAKSNGLQIAYEERGDGEPFVLLSGIGLQLVAWPDLFLDRLAARGFRVITLDNRDVGLSSKLDAAGIPPVRQLLGRRLLGLPVAAPYTLFDMASDVAGLLDVLDVPRAHVAGVSMGGMIAQAMAIAHGDRVASLVSMMSHSGGFLLTGRLRATTKLLRPPPRSREESIAYQLDFFRTAGSTKFYRDEAELAARVGRSYDRCFHPAGFARQFAAVLATGDMTPRLRSVRAPTLVLHGSVDPIFRPACGRATARAIPGARLQIVDGWGHDLAEGAWDVLIDAIAGHARGSRRAA
jgi:pimeloyl-ACP methyl ester carboxylesterase